MAEMTMSAKVGRYLAGLARRLKDDPGFMAYVLTVYQTQERLDDSALAERLGTSLEMLARLALCRRPDSEPAKFASQVRQIATYVGTDPALLANVARQVHSLDTLATRPILPQAEKQKIGWLPSDAGLLAAARDRDETEDEQSPPENKPSNGD
jgi:hypothetical protein